MSARRLLQGFLSVCMLDCGSAISDHVLRRYDRLLLSSMGKAPDMYNKDPNETLYSRLVRSLALAYIRLHSLRLAAAMQPACHTRTQRHGHVLDVQGLALFPRALTVEARKLEHDGPLIPSQRKKENQHTSAYTHVPIFGVYS